MSGLRWTVSQTGAREDYAVPRALHRHGELRRLYTNVWWRLGTPPLVGGRGGVRTLAGHFHADLSDAPVKARTWRTLGGAALGRLRVKAASPDRFSEYVRAGGAFAKWVAACLSRDGVSPGRDAFFGFFTSSLETLEALRGRGVLCVVDQADAAHGHYRAAVEEARRSPRWHAPGAAVDAPAFYLDRVAREWELADLVVVNSDWTKAALLRQGVAAEKIAVVPLAFEPAHAPPPQRPAPSGPLTVAWVGTVTPAKGIAYLVEAARMLEGRGVRFVVAGSIAVPQEALAAAPKNVTFLGRVGRDATGGVYRQGHVFAFPTLSDGFGLTQLEAMSHGLPVIATPNCGKVVDEGVDGLIVPAADAAALAQAIARLDDDRGLIEAMGRRALEKSRKFTLEDYYRRLTDAAARARGGGAVAATR